MANDSNPFLAERRPGESSTQPPVAERSPARAPQGPETRPAGGLGIVLGSGALAFLLGGAGAWAYLNYLHPAMAGRRPEARQAQGQEPGAGASTTDLASRVDDLSGKLERLQTDVDHVTKAAAPPDLEPLNQRISALEDLPRKFQALDARVSSLPTKIDDEGRKITTLMADMAGMRDQVTSLRTELPAKGIGETKAAKAEQPSARTPGAEQPRAGTPTEAPREISPPVGSSLQPGVELFKQKKYDQASEFFDGLTRTKPDDARAWYYAALARGLATRDWKGEAEKLVNEGVNREKAGKPEKSEIDSAFSDLTTETGKDWLAFYRRRAQQ